MREPTGCTATCRRSVRRERGTGPCLGAVILWSVVMVWAGWPGNAAAAARVWADFNGDGFADLAIGIPLENGIGGSRDAGAVQILYGSPSGLQAVGNQFWHQDSPGILDMTEDHDDFGEALTAGDFNGDGVDDLAVGVPGEAFGSSRDTDRGAVHVLYGSASGLQATGNQDWHQDTSGIPDFMEPADRFGAALTAGDFNGDDMDDLAIGVPGEDIGGIEDAGVVQIIFGSASGLTADGDQFWYQNTPVILDSAVQYDRFGLSLSQ